VAYGLMLPGTILALPRCGCLNVHGSLLPRWRGAAPIAAAILAGDATTGVSLMQMDEGLDTGPVIAQAGLPILASDTTATLSGRLATLGAELLVATLPAWLGSGIAPVAQAAERATFAPRLKKEAGRIDWQQSAPVIERKVRAYDPWPSAYTIWNGQRLRIVRASVGQDRWSDPSSAVEPGTVVSEKGRLGVQSGSGVLWLEEVQLAGRRILAAAAFLRGASGFIGSRLPS
jgi:methionyl-tRNA formyltransferase